MEFYEDKATRSIRRGLFWKEAEDLAQKLAGQGERVNKPAQVRKFYEEVVRLNGLAKARRADWENIRRYVDLLVARVAYAEGRNLVTEDFVAFIKDSVGQVESGEDLDVFATVFEAFIGFYKKYRE